MSAERKYIPMSEANTQRLRTTATLPFELHERVGLNVGRIEALCQVAGFRTLRIENDPKGETSQAVPQVVGIDGRGAAIAGKAAFKEVPSSQFSCDQDYYSRRSLNQARWKNLTISLNTEEMKRQILYSDKAVTDSKEWGQQIDSALRKAVINSGIRHLIGDFDHLEKIFFPLYYSWVFFDDVIRIVKGDTGEVVSTAVSLAQAGGILTALYSGIYGIEKPGEGRRVSVFFGPEIDRAIALAVMTYTSKLAKGLSGDK